MLSVRRLLLASILASAALLACNEATSPSEENPGEENNGGGGGGGEGGGDYGAVQTATYGDTLFKVTYFESPLNTFSVTHLSLDTFNTETSKLERIGYTVSGSTLTHKRGDSTVSDFASSVKVDIGSVNVVSGSYPVYSHEYVLGTPTAGLAGKARLVLAGLPGGQTWSHADSSGSAARVVVTVAGDSVQVQGKDIKLANGKKVTFNFKVKRSF